MGLSNVVAIAAAEELTLALKRDGTLVAWGQDYYGRSVTPPAGLSNVVAIAVSGNANLALVTFPPSRPVLGLGPMHRLQDASRLPWQASRTKCLLLKAPQDW